MVRLWVIDLVINRRDLSVSRGRAGGFLFGFGKEPVSDGDFMFKVQVAQGHGIIHRQRLTQKPDPETGGESVVPPSAHGL